MNLFSRQLSFIIAAAIIFSSCQKEDDLYKITKRESEILKSTSSISEYSIFYQNELFVRDFGKPVIVTRTIGNSNITNYEGCFKLHIQSGRDGDSYISSAVVKIDGNTLLNTSDFNNSSQSFQFDLCNLKETSIMEVLINGAPGSTLEIWIEGKLANSGTFVDNRDGLVYKWIKIGNQIWMAENLKATTFLNGEAIPFYFSDNEWGNLESPGYSWLFSMEDPYKDIFGALYNWYAVNDSRKIAPEGWHVPSDDEWTILTDYLGGENIAGGKLKDLSRWFYPNFGATNETGFSALPGCYRDINGSFYSVGLVGYWWTSTEYNYNEAWRRYMHSSGNNCERYFGNKKLGFSVRCVKD